MKFYYGIISKFILLILLILSCSNSPQKKETSILLIIHQDNISDDEYGFFNQLKDYTLMAAYDLQVSVECLGFTSNDKTIRERFIKIVSKKKPDGIILAGGYGFLYPIVEISNKLKIPFININNKFDPKFNMGKPREKFKYWIGEVIPDDEQAGYLLAKILSENAPVDKSGVVRMIAFIGYKYDFASLERLKGLMRYLSENKNVILQQVFETKYNEASAYKKFYLSKQNRYPKTTAVWTVSDGLAAGSSQAAKDLKLTFGKDYIVGGIDWTEKGIRDVKAEQSYVSVGGHVLEGVWALILIHDYLKEIDFISESVEFMTQMKSISVDDNYCFIKFLLNEQSIKIDFRTYSKYHNKTLKKYDFDISGKIKKCLRE